MIEVNLEEIQRKLKILSTPFDAEKYIEQGVISRYKQTKTKFYLNCTSESIPEEINLRTTAIQQTKGSALVITLSVKAKK
jgi:hypothetical protein